MEDVTPSTPTTSWIANSAYRAAVTVGLAVGYAGLGKMVLKTTPPKLGFTVRDVAMASLHVGLASVTQDILIERGILPRNIMK